MADQGAIGKPVIEARALAFPGYSASDVSNVRRQDGSGSGMITDAVSGMPLGNVMVVLLWRPTGQRIDRAWTDADGSYSFRGLDPTAAEHYVTIAFAPDGSPIENDKVLAGWTPHV